MQGKHSETEIEPSNFWDTFGASSVDQSYGDTESEIIQPTERKSVSGEDSYISTPDQDAISGIIHNTTWKQRYSNYLKDLRAVSEISPDISILNEEDLHSEAKPTISEKLSVRAEDLPHDLPVQKQERIERDMNTSSKYSDSSISSNPSESLDFVTEEYRATEFTNQNTAESPVYANRYSTRVTKRDSFNFVTKSTLNRANDKSPKIINTNSPQNAETGNLDIPNIINDSQAPPDPNNYKEVQANSCKIQELTGKNPVTDTDKPMEKNMSKYKTRVINTEIPKINLETKIIKDIDIRKILNTENPMHIKEQVSELLENPPKVSITDSQSSVNPEEDDFEPLQQRPEPIALEIPREHSNPTTPSTRNKSETQLMLPTEAQMIKTSERDMIRENEEYDRAQNFKLKEGNPISFVQGIQSFMSLKLKSHREVWKLPFVSRILSCCSCGNSVPEDIREIVGRLIAFSEVHFSLTNAFHSALLDAVLHRHNFQRNQEVNIAIPIEGLTKSQETELPLQIALSYPSSPLSLLFLLFLYEYFPNSTMKISRKHPIFLVLLSISQCFVDLISQNYVNQYLDVQDQALERCFFLLAGVVIKWTEIYEETQASWNSRYKVTKKLIEYAKANVLKLLVQIGEFYKANNSV